LRSPAGSGRLDPIGIEIEPKRTAPMKAVSRIFLALSVVCGTAYYVASLAGLEHVGSSGWFLVTLFFPPADVVYPVVASVGGEPVATTVLTLPLVSVLCFALGVSTASDDLELP
jgi:hypothetical protein